MQQQKYWLVWLAIAAAALGQTWQNGPTSGFQYWRFDGEYFPGTGKVYFMGGRLSDGNTDGSIWSYDPVARTYADVGVDVPRPISNYDIVLLRDDYDLAAGDTYGLYIFGGRLGVSPNNPTESVQVYYPVSNRARVLPTDVMPARVSGYAPVGTACIGHSNLAWTFGGFNSTTWLVTKETWLFDPLAAPGSKWTRLRDMSFGRAYRLCAAVDSFIFAMGGDTAYGSNLYARNECERLNVLDTASGWERVENMPGICGEARAYGFDNGSPYGYNGQIITGGRGTWVTESAHCYIYTVATDSWASFPSLLQARRNHAGAFIPGTQGSNGVPGIWVWGGRQVDDQTILQTSEYIQLNVTGAAEASARAGAPALRVVPNPARGIATAYAAPGAETGARLTVYDVLGKAVFSDENRVGRFRLAGLGAGTYVVRLATGHGIQEQKLVVTR